MMRPGRVAVHQLAAAGFPDSLGCSFVSLDLVHNILSLWRYYYGYKTAEPLWFLFDVAGSLYGA